MSLPGAIAPDAPARRVLVPPRMPSSWQLGGGAPGRSTWPLSGETMGTHWRAKVVARPTNHSNDQPEAHDVICTALDRVVALMSPWVESSDLTRFSTAAAGEWVAVAPETFHVLQRALEIARLTNGAFDPTIGTITDLLGFGPRPVEQRHSPGSTELRAAHRGLGHHRLTLDPDRGAVRQPGNLRLDLCSIAKGYAIDFVSDQLHAAGWTDHFLEIGGEARGRGTKPNGQPWWCGLEGPTSLGETVVALCESAVATSGNSRRRVEHPRGSIGHIISPFDSDHPCDHLHSVTVLAPTCMEADAWATALYLLGPAAGLALAEQHHLAARFINTSGSSASLESQTSAFTAWQD